MSKRKKETYAEWKARIGLPEHGNYAWHALVGKRFSRFVFDSMDRGIFEPQDDVFATFEQMRALISDALFYCDQWGPDECPIGIKMSAAHLVDWARREFPELLEGLK